MNSFTNTSSIGSISYILGGPDLTLGPYSFVQSPACGYSEDVTVTGLPSFITHEAVNRQFILVATQDFNFLKSFNVVITSTIRILNDNSKNPTSFTSKSS